MIEWTIHHRGERIAAGTVRRVSRGHFKRVQTQLAFIFDNRLIRVPETARDHRYFQDWVRHLPRNYERGNVSEKVALDTLAIVSHIGLSLMPVHLEETQAQKYTSFLFKLSYATNVYIPSYVSICIYRYVRLCF